MTEQQQEELNNALFEAISKGNVDECERLIQAGASVNTTTTWFDGTPLHWAAWHGHVDVCRLLVNNGTNVNATDNDGWTPLHHAALNDHVDVCRLLIERGANVNATNWIDWTPLHPAAWHGLLEVCRFLVDKGINVNATDRDGWTPLHQAARHGHASVCRLLIARGADVNATNNDGHTPLDAVIDRNITPVLAYFYVHGVMDFQKTDHTGQKPWDRLDDEQRQTLTKAMAEHQEKIGILETKGLPNELARLVMSYL